MTETPPPGSYPPPGGFPPPQQPGGSPSQGGYPPQQPGGYPPQQPGGFPPAPGGYPPAQGGFPPPPPGGYPPPPVPGGYPPPPAPGGGFAPPPPGYGRPVYNVGDAFSWAWNKFTQNAAPLIVATLVLALATSLVSTIFQFAAVAVSPDRVTTLNEYDAGFGVSTSVNYSAAGFVLLILGYLAALAVAGALGSAYIGGMLDIANGVPVSFGSFFRPRRVGAYIVLALLVGILTLVGFIACVLPGLVVALFMMFAAIALLDRNLSPTDAMGNSFNVVKDNFGNALLAWLVAGLTVAVGTLLCGVGLLVAAPVALLFEIYTYRKLSGAQVAA